MRIVALISSRGDRSIISNNIALSGTYHDCIPLNGISDKFEEREHVVVAEDGTRWEGILCGESGRAVFEVANKKSGFTR